MGFNSGFKGLSLVCSSDRETRNADRILVRKINVGRLEVTEEEWKMIETLLRF